MIKCGSHKKVYTTVAMAEDALIEAHQTFEYRNGTGPIAIYRCEDCGYYHLTSKGPMNEQLAALLKDGNFKRQQEATRWLNRLKK